MTGVAVSAARVRVSGNEARELDNIEIGGKDVHSTTGKRTGSTRAVRTDAGKRAKLLLSPADDRLDKHVLGNDADDNDDYDDGYHHAHDERRHRQR
jgi:hypothetical protein